METNGTSTPSSNSTSSDFSMYSSSISPLKFTLPSSLSLTPSTLSDDDGDHRHDVDCNTMQRLGQAQLVLECEELRDHLRELNNEIDFLRRDNAVLRSANTDLVKLLKNLFNASSRPFMGIMADEASDIISPTSVIMEQHLDRFSLPKSSSSSSSSSGYKNQQKPPLLHEGRVADHQVKYNQGMVKTELCKKWQESGACPYGDNCQFAHGVRELRPVMRHPRYKTQICRMVLAGATCPYGHRCHFRHDQHHI